MDLFLLNRLPAMEDLALLVNIVFYSHLSDIKSPPLSCITFKFSLNASFRAVQSKHSDANHTAGVLREPLTQDSLHLFFCNITIFLRVTRSIFIS